MYSNCENLKSISQEILKWLRAQENVKEESITDWLIYEMGNKVSNIKSVTFTRHEESKTTGADWEWWIISSSKSYKFRIQAKKMTSLMYKALNYKDGLQINTLIKSSSKTNSIPLYAFYAKDVTENRCLKSINNEGVYLAGAIEVFENTILCEDRTVTSVKLLNMSIPLSCLLGCPLLEEGVNCFIKKHFLLESTAKKEPYFKTKVGEYEHIPEYIQSLLYSKEKISIQNYEEQYKEKIKHLKYITIIDISEKNN